MWCETVESFKSGAKTNMHKHYLVQKKVHSDSFRKQMDKRGE